MKYSYSETRSCRVNKSFIVRCLKFSPLYDIFCLFHSSSTTSEIQTLDLRIMSWVFYHCATTVVHGTLHLIKNWYHLVKLFVDFNHQASCLLSDWHTKAKLGPIMAFLQSFYWFVIIFENFGSKKMFQLKAEKDRNLIEKEKQHVMLRFFSGLA